MNGGGPFNADPIAGVLNDRDKRAMAAQIIGQAYLRAYHLMAANRPAIELLMRYAAEQKLIPRAYGVDELFVTDLT